MTDRTVAQGGIDAQKALTGIPNSISPTSQANTTLQPILDGAVMQDEVPITSVNGATGTVELTGADIETSTGSGETVLDALGAVALVADSKLASVVGGSDISIDNTDPFNPVINVDAADPVDYVIVGDPVSLLANDEGYISRLEYAELYADVAGTQKLKSVDEVIVFTGTGLANVLLPDIATDSIVTVTEGDYEVKYEGSAISKRDVQYNFWVQVDGAPVESLGCLETGEDNMCHPFSFGRILALDAGATITILGQCASGTDKDWKHQIGARFQVVKLG